MKIYIKYMVSLRCKIIVQQELEKLEIPFLTVDLGVVETSANISGSQHETLSINLKRVGLEVLDDKRGILIDKIKNVIIEMIHHHEQLPKINYSVYISEKLGNDYTYLSNTFSEVNGITIQQYIIIHKIEKVKELMLYDELNLTEISYRMNYSSVAHLSNQFKKITGLTPSFYKRMRNFRKQNLENV
ncbi:AraC family transcriptional regulator [Aquiflexum sp. TKW24L]|uniref:helix-turn-helix domain-containing protein n=1 Tax=Aquiflexum sp. TKW24L TaxID=2942212 RepID=UPI0020C08554|nr:AraC family transcriptional regulator [Aquiflexum sp. TKW24L]MCL6259811.1 AraC family transcriptional regulator [Aquiflexum sp. TKW24L]